VIIRPLIESDIAPLARLMAATSLWQRYNITEASAVKQLSDELAGGATIAAAELDGKPVGFIWYIQRGAFNRSGYIRLIGVRQDVRGRGIGQALMEQAESVLFADSPDVFLLVSDFNLDAQEFYARLGFQQVGAIPDYVIPGITELIFHKRLSNC
jgi:ribosomal protein S18 acetylase RimI-like enzyme